MFGLVPFSSKNNLARKEDAFGHLFDVFHEPFFQSAFSPLSDLAAGFTSFKVDVRDLGNAYELKAELPGIRKEDINVSYDNSYLTIQAQMEEVKEDTADGGNTYIRKERRQGTTMRSFYIDHVDPGKIEAVFRDGVLTLHLPKTEAHEDMHQIKIQ